ncbi:protein MTSS 2-like isoform X2 [Ornithodoros turicata]
MTASVSAAFLDSFQRVADMATNTKGATKEVGKALTRLCLRHRSVEAKLKSFTASIMDHLVVPLQDKMEDWKKIALQLDKDHSKEFKRARQEIKKISTDTLRLQKKVRKGSKYDMQRSLDSAIQDVSDKYLLLEETEKQAVRRALIEERSRYCTFVSCLRPVVEEELQMLQEISHLQEIVDCLTKMTVNPQHLPSMSEQVIADLKGSDGSWAFQTPPSSPSSLGSRKSSMCSISSFNSSSSSSSKSHSPSHQFRSRSQQPTAGPALRLSSVSSQDSGFTSQDTLFMRPPSPRSTERAAQVPGLCDTNGGGLSLSACTSSTPASPFPATPSVTSTWPNLQDTLQFERAINSVMKSQRPHTISTAYERAGHQSRPALRAETFQPLEGDLLTGSNHSGSADTLTSTSGDSADDSRMLLIPPPLAEGTLQSVPPVPECSPLEDHSLNPPGQMNDQSTATVPDFHKPVLEQVIPQPIYVNAEDLGSHTLEERRPESPPLPPPPPPSVDEVNPVKATTSHTVPPARNEYARREDIYKTYSPSSSVSRFEGLSGSSTLPPKLNARRNSQPPPPPPVRRTSSITSQNTVSTTQRSSHSDSAVGQKGSNASDNASQGANHAKLIQALNARFSKPAPLEQAGLRFSLPSSRIIAEALDAECLPLPPPPTQLDHEGTHLPCPPLPEQIVAVESETPKKQLHPEKKLFRAHTMGYGERDALVASLNAKFTHEPEVQDLKLDGRAHQVSRKTSLRETTLRTSPNSAVKDSFKANLEQTLMKREPKRDSLPRNSCTEPRRSQSVGPTGKSTERRQFLDTLNARLAEQQRGSKTSPRRGSLQPEAEFGGLHQSSRTNKAVKVHNWLAGRGSVDLTACRESLMDQIRRGASLKRVSEAGDGEPALQHL